MTGSGIRVSQLDWEEWLRSFDAASKDEANQNLTITYT